MKESRTNRLVMRLWVVVCTGLSSCAVYHREPLPSDAALLADLTMLRSADGGTQLFDASDGIDLDEAATIAVLNNPGLRAVRAGMGIAHAQAFAAGLLPDPQVTVGSDNPTNHRDVQVNAYTLSIGYDVGALITHNAGRAAADAAAEQVRLDVVWQEWQVAQQARLAATRYQSQARKLKILRAAHEQFEARATASTNALNSGDLTVDVAGTNLGAALDIDNRLYQLEIQQSDTAHEIHALLGLLPEAELNLVGADAPPVIAAAVDATTVEQRPDLRALRAGYESQEARLRQAIWRQFPALTVTWNRLRDTSDVWTSGFGATLNLPFFTGARGDIAIERASREKLRAEYQQRLAQTEADIARLEADTAITQAQLEGLRARIPRLETMAEQARYGYRAGDLDAVVSINLDTALVSNKIELIDLEQTLWETRIALDTLLGRESP